MENKSRDREICLEAKFMRFGNRNWETYNLEIKRRRGGWWIGNRKCKGENGLDGLAEVKDTGRGWVGEKEMLMDRDR